MIDTIAENLQRGIRLLTHISDEDYSNCSIPPYYSSIGNNMRHVLDVFACVYNGLESCEIDFSNRERNELAQLKTKEGLAYFESVIEKLYALQNEDFDKIVTVIDDLGRGKVKAKYTLGSALIQAHSHAIHHFASIGFIINQLGLELPDVDFGYNPTTPR